MPIHVLCIYICNFATACSKHMLWALITLWLRAILSCVRTMRASAHNKRTSSQCISIGIVSISCSCEWTVNQPLRFTMFTRPICTESSGPRALWGVGTRFPQELRPARSGLAVPQYEPSEARGVEFGCCLQRLYHRVTKPAGMTGV